MLFVFDISVFKQKAKANLSNEKAKAGGGKKVFSFLYYNLVPLDKGKKLVNPSSRWDQTTLTAEK